jgi:methanogenic corrinoid protein MtbC1
MELKQHKTFSPRQVGRAIGVSEASIKRWCDKGILSFSKTAGGHRRLRLHSILDFLKENDFDLVQPEVLGLPATVGSGPRSIDQACRLFRLALEQGNEDQCLGTALDMHLAGHDMAVIADNLIANSFHALGDRWQHGEVQVYQERRGVEATRSVLLRLKDTLASPNPAAPVAIGATLEGDPYSLAGLLAELVLLEMGWQARFLGSGLPSDTIARAVQDVSPRMLWLSISSLADTEDFVHNYRRLYEICLSQQCAVVVGGRAITESLRRQIQYASYGDNLKHLRAFAQSLYLVR